MNEWLVVLDLDRTLTREAVASELLEQSCQAATIDTAELARAQAQTEAAGESFFPLEYLKNRVSPDQLHALKQAFLNLAASTPLLYDDVLPLFDTLHSHTIPTLIVTYGEHDWQQLKLEASTLHEREYFITPGKQKGELIASWRSGGTYAPSGLPPVFTARKVLLVDDKASSFIGLPDDCTGAWLQRSGEERVPSQLGSVPANVRPIAQLAEVPALLY